MKTVPRERFSFLYILVDFRFAKIKKGLPLAAASGFFVCFG